MLSDGLSTTGKGSHEAEVSYLAEIGFDPIFGARPLRRTIQREIENPISSFLIKNELTTGDTIEIDYKGEGLIFNIKKISYSEFFPIWK